MLQRGLTRACRNVDSGPLVNRGGEGYVLAQSWRTRICAQRRSVGERRCGDLPGAASMRSDAHLVAWFIDVQIEYRNAGQPGSISRPCSTAVDRADHADVRAGVEIIRVERIDCKSVYRNVRKVVRDVVPCGGRRFVCKAGCLPDMWDWRRGREIGRAHV